MKFILKVHVVTNLIIILVSLGINIADHLTVAWPVINFKNMKLYKNLLKGLLKVNL